MQRRRGFISEHGKHGTNERNKLIDIATSCFLTDTCFACWALAKNNYQSYQSSQSLNFYQEFEN